MPAQVIKVSPPMLLEAAAAVAGTSARTVPAPGAVPTPVPGSGSAFDGAWAGLGATMGTGAAAMTTEAAGVSSALQGISQAAVGTLQAEDDRNATQIQSVGQDAVATV